MRLCTGLLVPPTFAQHLPLGVPLRPPLQRSMRRAAARSTLSNDFDSQSTTKRAGFL